MKNIIKTTVLSSVVLLSTVSASFAAQKIAVFDVQEILKNSNRAIEATETLKKMVEEADKKMVTWSNDLQTQTEALKAKESVLSRDAYEEEMANLKKEYQKFRLEEQSINEKLERENAKLKKEILGTTRDIVEEIAKKDGYDVVLNKHMLVYSNDTIDISEEVLKIVNKRLK